MSELVTYEQAKELKNLGYEYRFTQYVYRVDNQNLYNSYEVLIRYPSVYTYIKAPLVSEALDFIREERGLRCAVELVRETNRFGDIIGYKYGGAYINQDSKEILLDSTDNFSEAESALLTAVLEYLKKGGNNE